MYHNAMSVYLVLRNFQSGKYGTYNITYSQGEHVDTFMNMKLKFPKREQENESSVTEVKYNYWHDHFK